MIKFLIAFAIAFSAIAATKIKDNTLKVGKQDGQDVYIYANEGSANSPFLVFDVAEGKWKQSNDGTNIIDIGSGSENFVDLTGNQTITGIKTFNAQTIVKDGASPVSLLYKIISNDELTNYFSVDSNGLNTDLNFAMNGTGAIKVPVGDTSERPTPAQGMLRYNTEEESFEGYNGSEWGALGSGGGGSAGINFVIDPSFEKNDLAFTNSLSGTTTYPLYTSNDKLYSEFNEVYFQIAHTGLSSANYSTSYTVTRTGLDGKQGLVSIWAKTAAQLDLCVDVDTNGCDTTLTLINDDTWRKYEVPIVFGTGNVLLKFVNASITGDVTLQLDNVYVGTMPDGYIQDVGQAHFVGSLRWQSANCVWASTSTPYAEFPVDTDCSVDNITGSVLEPSTKLPAVKIPNVKTTGYYTVEARGLLYNGAISASQCLWRINTSDGLLGSPQSSKVLNADKNSEYTIRDTFRFNTGGDKEIKIQAARVNGTGDCRVYADNANGVQNLSWFVHFFPDDKSTIVSQDTETLWGKYYLNTTQTIDGGANEVIIFDAKFSGKEGGNLDNFYNASTGILTNTGKERCFEITANVLMISVSQNTRPFLTVNKNGTIAVYSSDVMGNTVTNPMLQISSGTQCLKDGETLAVAAQTGDVNNRDIVASQINNISIREVNNSATIVGKFENINSSDLCVVEARSNDGTVIAGGLTDNIKFNEVYDNCNAWNGEVFTATKSGYYHIHGNLAVDTATFLLSYALVNGSPKSLITDNLSATVVKFNDAVYLNSGDTYSITPNSPQNMRTSPVEHYLYIQQMPDYEAIVKNLSNQKVKCQTKYLSANVTATGWISDLQFDNLTIGKKYRIIFQVAGNIGSGSAADFRYYNDNNSLNNLVSRWYHEDVYNINTSIASFVSLTNSLSAYFVKTGISTISGANNRLTTFAELCELPDTYVETTEF